MPPSSKPGMRRQIRMKKDLHKSNRRSPSGFSTDLKVSISSALELIKTLPSHYIFNRKKTQLSQSFTVESHNSVFCCRLNSELHLPKDASWSL